MAQTQTMNATSPAKVVPQTTASTGSPPTKNSATPVQTSSPTTPLAGLEEKKFYQKWWFLVILGVLLLGGIGFLVSLFL